MYIFDEYDGPIMIDRKDHGDIMLSTWPLERKYLIFRCLGQLVIIGNSD